MMKPQLEISQRLGADKGQYPTGAVGILRDQAKDMSLHRSQPLTLGPALIT